MKKILRLSKLEKSNLEEMRDKHRLTITRKRALGILLSELGYSINEIVEIVGSCRQSVSSWQKAWEERGIVGLLEKKRSGRRNKLNQQEREEALELVKSNPRNIKKALTEIIEKTGISISVKTLKRICKKGHLKWKRIKKTLKQKKDEKEYEQSVEKIAQLIGQEEEGKIDIYYFDESGFNQQSSVPYAWQEIGQHIQVPCSHGKNLNVLGFINHSCQFESYVFEQSINSDVVVRCFDEFAKTINKPTYVLVDNAPIHTSYLFLDEIEQWKKDDLYVQFISTYSPDLNIIEILWRKIKYDWLPFSSFQSFQSLQDNLFYILKNIGTQQYTITYI